MTEVALILKKHKWAATGGRMARHKTPRLRLQRRLAVGACGRRATARYDAFGASLFFLQAEAGIRDRGVTGVQTCALPSLLAAEFGGQQPLGDRHADGIAQALAERACRRLDARRV